MHGLLVLLFLAHHSLSGVYDTSRQIKLDGVIREFHFVNPHPYITVEIERDGRKQRWKMEMDNRYELEEIGVGGTTFKAGDRIVVSGSPGRDESPTLYIRRLDRSSDGFWYEQVGTEPRIRSPKK